MTKNPRLSLSSLPIHNDGALLRAHLQLYTAVQNSQNYAGSIRGDSRSITMLNECNRVLHQLCQRHLDADQIDGYVLSLSKSLQRMVYSQVISDQMAHHVAEAYCEEFKVTGSMRKIITGMIDEPQFWGPLQAYPIPWFPAISAAMSHYSAEDITVAMTLHGDKAFTAFHSFLSELGYWETLWHKTLKGKMKQFHWDFFKFWDSGSREHNRFGVTELMTCSIQIGFLPVESFTANTSAYNALTGMSAEKKAHVLESVLYGFRKFGNHIVNIPELLSIVSEREFSALPPVSILAKMTGVELSSEEHSLLVDSLAVVENFESLMEVSS